MGRYYSGVRNAGGLIKYNSIPAFAEANNKDIFSSTKVTQTKLPILMRITTFCARMFYPRMHQQTSFSEFSVSLSR